MSDQVTEPSSAGSPSPAKTLAELAFREGRRLAKDPNICAVGFGAKLCGGQPLEGAGLVFFVREKLAQPSAIAARNSWPIPASIDGFPTDVVELGELAAAAADRTPPAGKRGTRVSAPLIGGVATMALGVSAAGPGGYGTLGGQCFDNVTKAPLVLSNAHVWGQTAGVEIVQPITASTLLGANASPAVVGSPPSIVQTQVPPGLTAPLAFANSIAQTHLITGSESDPLQVGQAATTVTATTRTDAEEVTIGAPVAGLPPAGRRQSPALEWSYRRLSNTAVLAATSNIPRPSTKLLVARRLFSNAASYSGSQPVNLYAEIIPAAGGAPNVDSAHYAVALLYPLPAADKFIPRLLRPTTRQPVTTVTTAFSGFPAPARVAPASLPATAGAFSVDAALPGAFATPPPGSGLPAGTFVLRLPAGNVRLFVPLSTQVVIDIDLTGVPGLQTASFNSARDPAAVTVGETAGPGSRRLVTISGSEIAEVVLTGVTNALLFGVTSRRSSPESAPLCYSGSISAADLTPKGKWGVSLFVQAMDSGVPESANIVDTSIGAASLFSDCLFDVA
jgi:hypothetical protein